MATAETARLLTELAFSDKGFGRGMSRAIDQTGKLDKGMGRVGKGAGQLSSGVARAGTIIGAAAVTGIGAAAKAFIDFEDAFAGVRKTVDASEAQFTELEKTIRQMATTIPISATELAHLGEIGGQLGIGVDSLDEFIDTTAKLGVATDLTAEDAADALGRLGNILELTADDYDNLGSAVVRLGNKGAAGEAEIFELTKRFAAQGKQAGLTTQEILGLAEATASFTGLKEEAAGTAVSGLLSTLTKISAGAGKKGIKSLETLNKLVGTDFKKAFEKDASDALVLFLSKLGKLDKFEKARVLKTLGLDAGRMRQLLTGLSDNVEDVTKSFETADQGWSGNFLNEEAAKRFDTLRSKITLLKQNLVEAGINIGEGMAPAIERATEQLTGFLKEGKNIEDLKQLGKDLGSAIDSIDWREVLGSAKAMVPILKGAFTWAKRLFDVFNALPTEIKGAVAGLLVLNKLSGGLVGTGVGNIIGGIGETLTRNLGARIPGIGKAFVQPVFVTNMPVGGLGGVGAGGKGGRFGRLGGIGGLITGTIAVTLTGEAIALQQQISARSTEQAQTAHESLNKMIGQGAKLSDLLTAQQAVRDGIKDITSNPLLTVVQGDALTELQAMNAQLEKAIAERAQPVIDAQAPKNAAMNQASIASRENRAITTTDPKVTRSLDQQKTELGNIKNNLSTIGGYSQTQVTELGNVKNNITTLDATTRAASVAQIATSVLQGALEVGRDALQRTTTATAGTTAANASRAAGTQTSGAMSVAASRIVGAIWAARPVIQSTTVVQKYNVTQRGGATDDSRTRGGV